MCMFRVVANMAADPHPATEIRVPPGVLLIVPVLPCAAAQQIPSGHLTTRRSKSPPGCQNQKGEFLDYCSE